MKNALFRFTVFLQNLIFWPLALQVSLLFIPAAAIVVTVSAIFVSRRTTMYIVRRAISRYGALIIACTWPFARVRYEDLGADDGGGPFIFVCNHRSASDPFLMACLPFEGIQIVKQWPFRLPVLGLMARIAGYLSVHDMPVDTFYQRAGRLYNEGVCLISFPEGTRSGSRRMGPFTSSIFRLAVRLRATIVPLAIAGNENIPRKGSLVLHPGAVSVTKLPAVCWEEYRDMPVFQLKNHIRDIIQGYIDTIEK